MQVFQKMLLIKKNNKKSTISKGVSLSSYRPVSNAIHTKFNIALFRLILTKPHDFATINAPLVGKGAVIHGRRLALPGEGRWC